MAGLHLILGDEELLVDRAIGQVLRAARGAAGTDDVPVNRLRAGEVKSQPEACRCGAMIRLPRLGGEPFILNAELICYVEARPDTFVTLTTGESEEDRRETV